MTMKSSLGLLALGLSACALPPPAVIDHPDRSWRMVATSSDEARLRDWRSTFVDALGRARAAGHSAEIAAEGPLLEPDAALGGGPIPDGNYRCRVIKLGAKSAGMLDYVSYPAFTCRIWHEQGGQRFSKLTGSQRPVGFILAGDAMRQVFLGTLVLGDEQSALQYGRDEERNVAGFVERIGENRWRLLMPKPHFESRTDVLELIQDTAGS